MSTWHPPAPAGVRTGPRRRSAVGLALQFCLQWFWLPVRAFLDTDDRATEPWRYRFVLTPTRYRLERRGTRQEWEAWAGQALDRAIERGQRLADRRREENDSGRYAFRHVGPSLVPATTLRRHHYRGIGLEGLAELAARRGWQIRWETAAFEEVGLVRTQPPQPPYPGARG